MLVVSLSGSHEFFDQLLQKVCMRDLVTKVVDLKNELPANLLTLLSVVHL